MDGWTNETTASAKNPRIRQSNHPALPRRGAAEGFQSILFSDSENRAVQTEPPECFRDLNLDQIVDAITAGREEYNLKPFFYTRLSSLAAIGYRHEVMRDLENEALAQSVASFSSRMRSVRGILNTADKSYYALQKEAFFLQAAELYGEAVTELLRELEKAGPKSRGLLGFRAYLAQYARSDRFQTLVRETKKLRADLAAVRYCVLIKGGSVTVRNRDSEMDYSAAVEEAFAKFQQGAATDYRVKFPTAWMNHVDALVLERVARLNPAVFLALESFCAAHTNFLEKALADFDREIQFYVACVAYAGSFTRAGLKFCYPRVSDTSRHVASRGSFDPALAGKLIREDSTVVCNDFILDGDERILVVTGPNQGGKTTFARAFGQLHYLASLGCPVPGTEARLFLCDRIFTHFEREEDITNLRGKLEDDLVRIHLILQQATPDSILIINEIFSSTTLKDALDLSRKILERISQLDPLCVCVTFLDELSALNEKTVSMVAGVAPDNPTLRTFKIARRPADGLAFALALAEKYRLTYERLKGRLEK